MGATAAGVIGQGGGSAHQRGLQIFRRQAVSESAEELPLLQAGEGLKSLCKA